MNTLDVPFIADWNERQAYSKLLKNKSVHNPAGMQNGFGSVGGFEAQVGSKNLIDASLLALLSQYRRAVCKVSCEGINFQGQQGSWVGTGFLVGPNILVTNNHVLNSEVVAGTATVDFEFERTPEDLFSMAPTVRAGRRELQLDPSRLFVTSPALGGLDYTFVWIGDEASRDYGIIPMSRGSFTGRLYDPVFLIHHPNGEFKQASVDDTELLNVDGDLLLYAADTERGSSGAPVITRNGKLCGLHHAFREGKDLIRLHGKRSKSLQDGNKYTVANEGIKFSAIAIDLENRLGNAGIHRNTMSEVLGYFTDSDSLTGPYGARGRSVEATSTVDKRVIQAYNATEQDIDVAVWNLDWLNAHNEDAATLKRAATVFADITQDIWVLDGISRETADALNAVLKEIFHQDYVFAFADDETHPAQPITALFYNSRSVSVTRLDWPDDISRLWRSKAERDLGLKTVSGPIFPSFPARFKVTLKDRTPTASLTLLPLLVGTGSNMALRRAVAALIMADIVEKMTTVDSAAGDWLIVGDVNTPMRRTRLEALKELGYTSILALDRDRGGFSYLRSKQSILSQLFVPKGTERIFDDMGHVTVVDRVFEGRFADALSGVTPYGVRVSLVDQASARDLEKAKRILSKHQVLESSNEFLERSAGIGWRWQNLDKPEFMQANAAQFAGLIGDVNEALQEAYGPAMIPLTPIDLYVLIYCEAGYKNGVIDPNAAHSLGERGLLPLPSNLSYWMGSAAPAHDQLLSLPDNVRYYSHYLGHIKNKAVRTSDLGMLYTGLFGLAGVVDNAARQARLLAGIIHGYFLDQNYRGGRTADLKRLTAGYLSDSPIDIMLAGTGYVHDGTTILSNRQQNVDAAFDDYAEVYSV